MVHQYQLNGYNIVLDSCSGSIHVVDEVAYDIIALFETHTPEEIVAAMLEKCSLLSAAGYRPYYLYRQKNTLQNLENVGWSKPGKEGFYNIYIMEEVQTILSAGAGGSTKLVDAAGHRMQRIFNFKYPNEYIQRFDEVLERKKGVAAFYDHDLGT